MARVADAVAAIALSLLITGCGKPAQTAAAEDAALLTPPPAPTIPPDYGPACLTALSKARSLAPELDAANLTPDLDLKLIAPGPQPRIACPISHNDDEGSVVFEVDCQAATEAMCVTVVSADLAGKTVYLNNAVMARQLKSGLQALGLGDSE